MKKTLNLFWMALLICGVSWAQAPGEFNYQTIVRDNNGDLISNQSIEIKVSILDESTTGSLLLTETHTKTSNDFGLVNLKIGSIETTSFANIDWSLNDKYLKIEVDAGSGFVDMGTVQLLSVPYALFANNVANKDDADADPINEIQDLNLTSNILTITDKTDATQIDLAPFQGTNTDEQTLNLTGTDLTITGGNTIDVSTLQDGVNDADNDPLNEIQVLSISNDTIYLADGGYVKLPIPDLADSARVAGMAYTAMNAENADVAELANTLGSNAVYSTSNDTLFVVKDHTGNVVFAVFPDGAQVIINEAAKGTVGGFAVSGRSPTKAEDKNILSVTADSTSIYVNDTVDAKGKVGGFTVSGRSPTKGSIMPMFVSTVDSTRIFTNDTISGFGIRDNSLGSTTSYLNLTPLNYFIGHRAGESVTTGKYNTFIGYETGLNSTWGNGNMFLGFNAGRSNVDGALNVFIGNDVGYNFTGADDGEENIFIGNDAGYNCITTANSIFIGTRSGYSCGASYGNTFIGDRTASFGIAGDNNTLLGSAAGFRISGSNNVFIGAYAGNATTNGSLNTYVGYQAGISSTGKRNVFIGASAGAGETGSNKLYIANSADSSLITGDFVAQEVFIDGALTATTVTPSDINLKTNFIEIKSGLKLLSSLTGYFFNWNDLAKREFNYSVEEQQIGIIAQDVEKIFPQMVVTNSNGYKAVEYSKFSPIIIEAIKEQQQQIEELKAENKILKQKLNEVIEMIESK